MAKTSPNDLTYGHLGQAVFNIENSAWNFGRRLGQRNELAQLGIWTTVLAPATKFDRATTPEQAQSVRSTQLSAKALGRNNPELVPSLGLLPELAIASAAVTSITSTYDPTIGPLLSFGSFTFQDHYENPRVVAALPAGECGNILRLVALRKEKHGWGADKSIWVEGPSIVNEDSGYWAEDAAPIQQVCFAQGEYRSAFLAVRFPTRTVLFRPIYRSNRTAPKRSQYYELPYSKIDAQPIIDIPIELTGGVPHVDVTFNPDYQRQVGLVDQKGNWSIWDIEGGKREGKTYALSCAAQGSITLQDHGQMDELETKEALTRDDGWSRILWIGDVNTILVCNRRTTRMFDIRAKAFTSLKCSELIPKRSADWILDVERHPKNKHQFFVLTSTRLFLLAVTCPNDVSRDDSGIAGASVLIAWTHFQAAEDITLQLCVPNTSDEDSMILMHSRLKNFIMVFRFQDDESEISLPFSSSDPVILNLDNNLFDSTEGSRHTTHLHIEQLHFGEGNRPHEAGAGHEYLNGGIHFYRLSAMLSDLSVHQTVLYSHESDIESTVWTKPLVEPFSWATIVHPRRHIPSETLVELDDNDLVVPDGIETTSVPKTMKPYRTPKMVKHRLSTSLRNTGQGVDFSFIYDALTGIGVAPANSETTSIESEDVSVVIDKVKSLLTKAEDVEEVPRETLLEFANSKIKVTDVDETSSQLHDLLRIGGHDHHLELRRIANAQTPHLPNGNNQAATISSLYDTILQNWIAPLPADIHARIRQSKERLARRIAAEVMLASTRIYRPDPIESTEPPIRPQISPRQDSTASLPILPSYKGQYGMDDIKFASSQSSLPSSQPPSTLEVFSQPASPSRAYHQTALPTPEPTPSIATSTTSFFTSTSNPFIRLSQHLQINTPAPEISQGVNQILMHWQPGTDPSAYDWDSTTRALDQEQHDDDDDETSAAKREKLKRKAERLAKRQKREAELMRGKAESQPQFLRSSPGPMIGRSGSGVGTGFGLGGGMSSQTQSQSQPYVVQSQVEPGRHGGRPKLKKKGKMRVSGF